MTLFKGYIEVKDKKSVRAFANRKDYDTLETACSYDGYAGVLADDTVLIDIDSKEQGNILFDIIEALEIKCQIRETDKGFHFYFKNNDLFTSCKTKAKLAIGLSADIKIGSKATYGVLKNNGVERPIVYDILDGEQYDVAPSWLQVVNSNIDIIGLSEGGRNQTLFNYILTLQGNGMSKEDVKQCLGIINRYVLSEPLDERELETITRDEAFQKELFFSGQNFLFDKFAQYMKSNDNIIKMNDQLYVYDNGVYKGGNHYVESKIIKHIPRLNASKRTEVVKYLEILIDGNTKQSDASLIAFANGIYDLRNDSLTPFTPDVVITNKINWDYNPYAYSELVDNTLNKLACHDKEIRMLLEEAVGYSFFRRNELRKSFFLKGGKHNGKSTFLDMLQNLLGDENVSNLDLNQLSDRFSTSSMMNTLANIGDDIADDYISNTATFKKIVSGDRIKGERKGKDEFFFNPYCKLYLSANNLPKMKDRTGAVIDRLVIIPFNASFSRNDPDFRPYIKYELREQECMEYLIKIGIEGLKRVLENQGFTVPDSVVNEVKEYELENDPLLEFLNDYTEDDLLHEDTSVIYRKYHESCLCNGLQPLSKVEFVKRVNRKYGFKSVQKMIKGKRIKVWEKL